MPNRNEMIATDEAQPFAASLSRYLVRMANITPKKASAEALRPNRMPRRRGTREKELMPCQANRIMRGSVYLVVPLKRLPHSKSTVELG